MARLAAIGGEGAAPQETMDWVANNKSAKPRVDWTEYADVAYNRPPSNVADDEARTRLRLWRWPSILLPSTDERWAGVLARTWLHGFSRVEFAFAANYALNANTKKSRHLSQWKILMQSTLEYVFPYSFFINSCCTISNSSHATCKGPLQPLIPPTNPMSFPSTSWKKTLLILCSEEFNLYLCSMQRDSILSLPRI